jgi:magnesium transporter
MIEQPRDDIKSTGPPGEADADDTVGLTDETIYAVERALEEERFSDAKELAIALHAADLADLLQTVGRDQRVLLLNTIGPDLDPEVLAYLDPAVREDVIERIAPRALAQALSKLDSDDALEVLEDLDEEQKQRILAALPATDRFILEEGLAYPEESAGRIMQREVVAIPSAWSVGQTIDYMRAATNLPQDFYDIYVVGPDHKPLGYIPVSRVLRTRRPVRVAEILETELRTVPVTMDQEEVAYLFRQYGLVSAPVVDESGRLVGVITVDDAVEVIEEEAEEDLMRLSGLAETDLYSATLDTSKARVPWLAVNLITAIIASLVIGLFEGTIEQIVALAVLMPIVASMGGNGGTQTLTVAVRALATKDLTGANAPRFVGKEVMVGLVNGVVFAILVGLVAWVWFHSPEIGLVIAAAMIINMIVAGLSGTLIPIGLEKLRIDPAVASSVFLTTITDVVGFFAFLGLAALFLL